MADFTRFPLADNSQEHRAGEKMFVDFSGDGIEIVSPIGEVLIAKLFVAVLGASNLTYVEAVLREDLDTWIGCHVRALAYFGGVPEIAVPDNLKSGVSGVHRYEPEVNRTYSDLAQHYGFVVIPARARKPRDKAKVEQGVLLAERWIIAALRNHRFSDLFDVTDAIAPLVTRLNERPMRKLGRSRRQVFEANQGEQQRHDDRGLGSHPRATPPGTPDIPLAPRPCASAADLLWSPDGRAPEPIRVSPGRARPGAA